MNRFQFLLTLRVPSGRIVKNNALIISEVTIAVLIYIPSIAQERRKARKTHLEVTPHKRIFVAKIGEIQAIVNKNAPVFPENIA